VNTRADITLYASTANAETNGSVELATLFQGSGCPKCAPYWFQDDKPAILYYLRVSNPFGDPLYKIGISNRTVMERFPRDISKITILDIQHFPVGADAYAREQEILEEFDADRYDGPDILRDNGNDELFILDVLRLAGADRQLAFAC